MELPLGKRRQKARLARGGWSSETSRVDTLLEGGNPREDQKPETEEERKEERKGELMERKKIDPPATGGCQDKKKSRGAKSCCVWEGGRERERGRSERRERTGREKSTTTRYY